MGKIEKLLDKTKRNGETKKKVVYSGIIIGLILAFGLFFGLYCLTEPLVDDMLAKEEINLLFDFYDAKIGLNETAVYFMGNSIVGTAVYTPVIDECCKNAGYNISSYNLLSDGESPYLRALQIEKIAESRPSLVIYGLSYAYVNDCKWIEERADLAQGRYTLTPELVALYTDEQLDHLTRNLIFYKRGLLLRSTILPNSARTTDNYVKEPYGVELRKSLDFEKSYEKIQQTVASSSIVVTADDTQNKRALLYNVKTLMDAGIPVIIINMPIHPLLSETISDESRTNYFNILNQTGATWIDMEKEYGDEHFRDTQHTLWSGTTDFSQKMANLIIQELN